MKLVEGTELEELLRDESKLETIIVDALKASDDPMAKEIGEGLAGGTMSWRTIATTSAYADFVDRGLTSLRQFDFTRLAGDLEAAQEEAAREKAEAREGGGDDHAADLWQGLRRKKR
jgi:hypothetical protein